GRRSAPAGSSPRPRSELRSESSRGDAEDRIRAVARLYASLLDQLVHAREYVGAAHVRRDAVRGQPLVRVALDLLAARAVEDLGAGGAADRRPGAGLHRDDRLV